MKCLLTILLFALVSCATPSSSEDGIKISIDVHELPSIGLAISTTDYDIQLVNFDSNKHGEYVINPNRSLEKASCHFLMTAIRKSTLYMLDS